MDIEDDTDTEFIDVDSLLAMNKEDTLYQLPPHQKFIAHKMDLIAMRDVEAAGNDATFKRISRANFAKCQALWN